MSIRDRGALRRGVVALVIGVHVAFLVYMLTSPRDRMLSHVFVDDTFYYLKIARRFGEASWPSFDGKHITTGFHPLWLIVLVALSALVTDPWHFACAAAALSSTLMLAACLVLGRALRRAAGEDTAAVFTVLAVGAAGVAQMGMFGMEVSLAALLLSLFLYELFAGQRRPLVLGALAGLATLARLDTILTLAVAGLVDLHLRREGKRLCWAAAIGAAVVLPFLAWLHAVSGHLTTNSAAMKTLVTRLDAEALYGGRLSLGYARWACAVLVKQASSVVKMFFGGVFAGATSLIHGDHPAAGEMKRSLLPAGAVVALLLGAGLALSMKLWRPRGEAVPAQARGLFLALSGGAALHFLASAALLPGQADRWYWVVESLAIAALLTWAASAHPALARWVGALAWASVIGLAALTLMGVHGRVEGSEPRAPAFLVVMGRLAGEVRDRVPRGDKIGSCNAGTVSYLSGADIINLDGLVNDWSFYEARQRGDVRRWAQKEEVRWFVDCFPAGQKDEYAALLGLRPGEIEPVVSIPGAECDGVLWRLRWATPGGAPDRDTRAAR